MLDIFLLRDATGGNTELIRESERRRGNDPTTVDRAIEADTVWRKQQHVMEKGKKLVNDCSRTIRDKMKAKEAEGTDTWIPDSIAAAARDGTLTLEQVQGLCVAQIKELSKFVSSVIKSAEAEAQTAAEARDALLKSLGNIVHETVPVGSDEETCNETVRTFGERATAETKPLNHVDMMKKLGCLDTTPTVSGMAGHRGFVLRGPLVQMQYALISYAIAFLMQRGSTPFYPPLFMNHESMAAVAQLSQFDEELYKVSTGADGGDDKYLIATSEQPLAAYHKDKRFTELPQPIKYAGISTCFRKEAGSSGRDTLGIFRVHQFDKIEQFVVCSPRGDESWRLMEEMITNAEDFNKSLGLPYRVVNICSGALNNAAAKKYDLEAWFPASETYRELVSCSNCTDYQARRLNCRFGQNTRGTAAPKAHVHMLNSTLCAVTRTLCCIVENYQTEEGVVVPEVLRPFMMGTEMIKFADAEKTSFGMAAMSTAMPGTEPK